MSIFVSIDQDMVFIDGGDSLDKPFSFTASFDPQAAADLATALLDASKAAASYSQDSIWGTPNNRFLHHHVERVNADITIHISTQSST